MKKTQRTENPFPFSDSNKRYYTADYFLRTQFGGQKACKVPIDAGFTCPNRDGTKGHGGCSFCSGKGSGEFALGREHSITEQIDAGIQMMSKKWRGAVFIPYFQSFTNTYAPISVLKEKYNEALRHPLCSGICIATRPDCITPEVSELLHEIARNNFLMLELGLQTVHDETAASLNRGYGYADFLNAYDLVKDLFVCVHLINGLPGETREMMLESARRLSALDVKAVKIHSLYVTEGTEIAKSYLKGGFNVMEKDEYVHTVCDQLEILPPTTVIERVTGDGAPETLIAPEWSLKKLSVQNDIDKELYRRGSYQGIKYTSTVAQTLNFKTTASGDSFSG